MDTNETLGELADAKMSQDRYDSRGEAINEVVADAFVAMIIAAERAKEKRMSQKTEEGR